MYLQLDTRHENLDMLGTAIVHSAFDPCILWKYFVFYRNICKQIKNISVTTYCNSARHVWCPFRFDPHLVSEGWPHLLMMKFWTTISPQSLHWLGLAAGATSKNVLPPPRLHGDVDDGCKILCHRILPKTALRLVSPCTLCSGSLLLTLETWSSTMHDFPGTWRQSRSFTPIQFHRIK